MSYRLGADVGGTFTDLLLVDESTGEITTAKVPSTPTDPSVGVLDGVLRVCDKAGVSPEVISHVMHGTTVATNTVLTGTGARVGLVTTRGYRQILQIARSFVPGGLGAWVIYNKSEPMAPLELTIEADERTGADGQIVGDLDEEALLTSLKRLGDEGIEALTVCLINSYANNEHEMRVGAIAAKVLPDIPVSLSSTVIPEMQEYERAVTTVANSYVRPRVETYVQRLEKEISSSMGDVKLNILRSDGGLASAESAAHLPVNLLMSGPAGGVAGAAWVAGNAGYKDLLTLDMGGTSTDVALIQGGVAQLRRETTVGDVTVRASSIDVRTVGAGGGSIAHVPEITRALRVGPQSAGADPGPAAYQRGGTDPTVTDANLVLGYLPSIARLGGEMALNVESARDAVSKVARAMDLSSEQAALGIYDIVNENMFGALRLVSVEQGHDPRDFALIAFGGAGPLHANALGRLMGSWPVIIPPGPGVLCAYGDATTRLRDEASRTFVRRFSETSATELTSIFLELGRAATRGLRTEGNVSEEETISYQVDLRYHGQGLLLTVDLVLDDIANGLDVIAARFDEKHEQLFTFALPAEKEIVNLRAVALGSAPDVRAQKLKADSDPQGAIYEHQPVFVDGEWVEAPIYQRVLLGSGAPIRGPAIVTEMDSTTLVLPGHVGVVDTFGNILIRPVN